MTQENQNTLKLADSDKPGSRPHRRAKEGGSVAGTALSRILEGISATLKEYVMSIPESYRLSASKAYAGIGSPRNAIAAKCRDCVCHENAIKEIRYCTSYRCPIFQFRPYQIKERTK